MPSRIVQRIAARIGAPELFSQLVEQLPQSDLQSLLLEIFQARAARLKESDLAANAGRGLLAPSKIDARSFNLFDRVAFETAADFEAVELSPVAPLGLNRVLGDIDQNNVLTAIRNCEVLGDPTTALAIECMRRRKRALTTVRLACSHRLIRMQPFEAPFVPHFRLFALATAGRDTGGQAFEIQQLAEHIRFYLQLFRALNSSGFQFGDSLVEISDTAFIAALLAERGITREQLRHSVRAHVHGGSEQFLSEHGITLPAAIADPASELAEVKLESFVRRLAHLKAALVDPLQQEFPEAQFRFNLARLEGLGYYRDLCLRISPTAPDRTRYPIVDGGATNWTARLLQNQKERFIATGIGSEFVCMRYRVL